MKRSIGGASLAVLAIGVLASQVEAASLAPTRASEVVSLYGTSTSQPTCASGANSIKVQFRINSDGTQGPAGYVVPLGQVLVVTDIAYRVHSGPAGADFQGVLALDQVGGSSQMALIPAGNIDGNGVAVGTAHWTQGPVVKGGKALCFTERQGRGIDPDSQVVLHGFLAKDR